mgnify:CR=1 FL=1
MKTLKTLMTIAFLSAGLAALPTAHAEDQGRDTAPRRVVKHASVKKAPAAKRTAKKTAPAAKRTAPAAKKVKNFDFMADDITADRIRPDGTAIFGLQSVDHKSLIRLRSEFIAEIVKSAEML